MSEETEFSVYKQLKYTIITLYNNLYRKIDSLLLAIKYNIAKFKYRNEDKIPDEVIKEIYKPIPDEDGDCEALLSMFLNLGKLGEAIQKNPKDWSLYVDVCELVFGSNLNYQLGESLFAIAKSENQKQAILDDLVRREDITAKVIEFYAKDIEAWKDDTTEDED